MTLADLQRDFRDRVLTGATAIDFHIPTEARRGLAVYHHAYRATLIACLADAFEKTMAWLGEDAFETAARDHIETHPSRSWTLNDYGEGFEATLAALHPLDPEVAELAWLDWNLRRAFDGPDSVVDPPATLVALDWETATLRLAPTLAYRPVSTNCAALWRAMADDEVPPAAATLERASIVAVWRQGLSPQFRTLDLGEADALAMANTGVTFGALCAAIADSAGAGDDPAAVAGGYLRRWLSEGLAIGANAR